MVEVIIREPEDIQIKLSKMNHKVKRKLKEKNEKSISEL